MLNSRTSPQMATLGTEESGRCGMAAVMGRKRGKVTIFLGNTERL